MIQKNTAVSVQKIDEVQSGLIRVGGFAALLTVVISLVEIAITFLPGGNLSSITVQDWFALFNQNVFMGLRNLGLLNILFTCVGLPLFLALFWIHKSSRPTLATLAMVVSFVGAAVFLATNRAFAMLDLSNQYRLATSLDQRLILEAAGQALLAVGESHTPGTFIGFTLSEIAGALISIAMLRGSFFSKVNAMLGMIGFSFLFIFEIGASFVPEMDFLIMIFAMIGGILNMIWGALTGIRMLKPQKVR